MQESGGCDGPFLIQDGINAKRFGDHYATLIGCPPGPEESDGTGAREEKS